MLFKKSKTSKKALSLILVASMISALATTSVVSTMAVSQEVQEVTETSESSKTNLSDDYALKENVQDGVILHAWNWSFDNIRKRLPEIAESGYSAVQTSVAQKCKQSTVGKTNKKWWVYYQPASFELEDREDYSALGTKADLQALCEEADKYGIKVIVDVVANHLGNDGDCTKSQAIPEEIRENDDFWHSDWSQYKSDSGRYGETQQNVGGLPDLNTKNKKVQNYVLEYLHECIDVGVGGFRFDTTKHIETENSLEPGNTESDFWRTVLVDGIHNDTSGYNISDIDGVYTYAEETQGFTPYIYGEILGGIKGDIPTTEYTQYMSITDDVVGNNIRKAIASDNVSGSKIVSYYKGKEPQKYVLWAESHDTYSNDETSGSSVVSDSDINKTWALVASRNKATALYYARSDGYCGGYIGEVYSTECFSKEVAEVNKFHNYFDGQSEYLATSGTISYNIRGTSGAVLVNVSGNKTSMSVPAKTLDNGTYVDQISGNVFTVSEGQISGKIGDTGIAVIYNPKQELDVSATPGTENDTYQYSAESVTVTLNSSEAESAVYSIDGGTAVAFSDGDTITMGADKAYETTQTLVLNAEDSEGNVITKEYKFFKTKNNVRVCFDSDSRTWSEVYTYVYNKNGTENSAWPGEKAELDSSTGYYYYDIPSGFESGNVIWVDKSNTGNRYPASGDGGLAVNGKSHLLMSDNSWVEYEPDNGESDPVLSVTPGVESGTYEYTTDTLEITLTAKNVTNAMYSINEGTAVSFTDGMTITLGSDYDFGTEQKVTVTATDNQGNEVSGTYTFYKSNTVLPPVSYYIGDVNSDNEVDMKDCIVIQSVVLNKTTLETTAQKLAGDVDNDGKIKLSDMIIIMRYLIGFENSYNIGEFVQGSDSSTEPTQTPTETPTDEPTQTPTETPTDEPTQTPTETPTDEPTESRVIYLNTSATPADGVKYCVYVWEGNENQFIDMDKLDTELYSCSIPSKYTNVIFIKMSYDADTSEDVWNNLYNRTGDLKLSDSYDLFVTTKYDTSTKLNGHSSLVGNWSTYSE